MESRLKFTEQEFRDRASSSIKSGCSYIGGDLFLLPNGANGWKIVDGKTWKILFASDNLDKLYWYYVT
jgi:hypothetical protein